MRGEDPHYGLCHEPQLPTGPEGEGATMSEPDWAETKAREWLEAWERDWTKKWRDQLAPDLAALLLESRADLERQLAEAKMGHNPGCDDALRVAQDRQDKAESTLAAERAARAGLEREVARWKCRAEELNDDLGDERTALEAAKRQLAEAQHQEGRLRLLLAAEEGNTCQAETRLLRVVKDLRYVLSHPVISRDRLAAIALDALAPAQGGQPSCTCDDYAANNICPVCRAKAEAQPTLHSHHGFACNCASPEPSNA